MLGFDCLRLSSTNEGGVKMMGMITGHVANDTESLVNQFTSLLDREPVQVWI
jgi:hypothetical protein